MTAVRRGKRLAQGAGAVAASVAAAATERAGLAASAAVQSRMRWLWIPAVVHRRRRPTRGRRRAIVRSARPLLLDRDALTWMACALWRDRDQAADDRQTGERIGG
jgi:hypothetical protein